MKTVVAGRAEDQTELFEFTIQPFVTGGFLLSVKYSGHARQGVTGAGVWPTVEKAKTIAEETAKRLLHGATVIWTESE